GHEQHDYANWHVLFLEHCGVLMLLHARRPRGSTLFPYTTLFRSWSRPRSTRCTVPASSAPPGSSRPAFTAPKVTVSRAGSASGRSEEHTSELQSRENLVCRLLLSKKIHDSAGRTVGADQNGLLPD